MNETSPISAAAPVQKVSGHSRRFPFRYARLALAVSLIYAVFFVGISWIQGRVSVEKLPNMVLLSILFGTLLTAYFAFLEAKAMKQLGIPFDNGQGVPDTRQKRTVPLAMNFEEALAKVESALFLPGVSVEKRDPAGVFMARTAQTWKGCEYLTVTVSGRNPVEVTVESRPRFNFFKLKIDYGKNWENVETIRARLLGGETQKLEMSTGSAGLSRLPPPKFFEVGAWQRLLPVEFFYAFAVWGISRRALALEDSSAFVPALMLVTLPLTGALLELRGYGKFRRASREGPRVIEQETMEAILNNSFPLLFMLGMLMRPELPLWSGENVVMLLLAGVFGYIFVSRSIERGRERARRDAIAKERETAELQRQLAEAKLAALSAQIEPHFLFNTLASIQYLTRHDADKAHAMVSDLIRYLRLVLPRMKQTTARLTDELELVRAYLSIMQIRMGPRLAFRVDDAAALAGRQIPTMVLITLVENAIKHGLERKSEGGEILVHADTAEGTLRIQVADTGGGFSTASSGTGIGLANVRERLRTLYGERGQLALAANEPSGVVATVSIPLERT